MINKKLFIVVFFLFLSFSLVAQAQKRFILTATELDELERVSEKLVQKNNSLKKRLNDLLESTERLQKLLKQKENSLNSLRNYLDAYESEMNKKLNKLSTELEKAKEKIKKLYLMLFFVALFCVVCLSVAVIFYYKK